MKEERIPASFITAYDYPSACFCEQAGIDLILVGDSGGMTMLGHPSTLPVTMQEMLHFTSAVCRAQPQAFIVGDMPYMSYQPSNAAAVRNAGEFMRLGCDAVKLEVTGGAAYQRISAIHRAGIPVMAHLGLTPQSASLLGGYRVQGKENREVQRLIHAMEGSVDYGASLILLEAMPEDCASAMVARRKNIPTYGIGAGRGLDGQLLIYHDVIGSFVGDIHPKFAKRYAHVDAEIRMALRQFKDEVQKGLFPAEEHIYK